MKHSEKLRIYEHLELFKRKVVKVVENGTWVGNGKQYGHILPVEKRTSNLIDGGYFSQLLATYNNPSIKKHRSFHHLNSSQALAFNLFEPFRVENCLETILKMTGVNDTATFSEYEHLEPTIDETNFDFFIATREEKVFFEVKYTEDAFGTASDDEHHNQRYKEVYVDLLKAVAEIEKQEFFRRYQLWRNICYSAFGTVVFVFPRFREDLLREVEHARAQTKRPENIRVLFVDDICALGKGLSVGSMQRHFGDFQEKYLGMGNA